MVIFLYGMPYDMCGNKLYLSRQHQKIQYKTIVKKDNNKIIDTNKIYSVNFVGIFVFAC